MPISTAGTAIAGSSGRKLRACAFKPDLRSIGYHYVIEVDGALRAGRLPDEVGAHAAGHNADSIGVCMVGTDAFTAGQWKTLVRVIGEMGARFGQLQILGHRDLSPDTDGDGRGRAA